MKQEQKISLRIYRTLHQNLQRARKREKVTRKYLLPLLYIYYPKKPPKKGRGKKEIKL